MTRWAPHDPKPPDQPCVLERLVASPPALRSSLRLVARTCVRANRDRAERLRQDPSRLPASRRAAPSPDAAKQPHERTDTPLPHSARTHASNGSHPGAAAVHSPAHAPNGSHPVRAAISRLASVALALLLAGSVPDRKRTRLKSSHEWIY